jgi:tetratricopeptide (TPR) repeat protein
MQRERFAVVKAIFAEVETLAEPDRSRRLQELSSDPEVIAEVRTLLDRTEVDAARFAKPAMAALAAAADLPGVGDRLGAWTLVEEIGRGGMGTVFRAQRHDGHFEQVAAIKLSRGLASLQALERLAQERQILARLTHPNIARLLDGGATASGQPYLVMEYVAGEPIDRYCRARNATVPEILRLMTAVCDAVGFAHQQLIVHCDLKPANIVVGADGRPLLLDFGIARLLDTDGVEDSGAAYTPGYASPEQRAGHAVSTATDVYGLGRILSDLLQPAAADGGARIAALPAPLAAIVARATADDPAQRYAGASLLADDLRRYLERRPVVAMGNRRLYQLGCHLRRNALPTALAAVALIALIGGLVGTTINLREARQQRAQAQAAGARAERTADFLGNLLNAIDPDRARDLDTRLLRELLDRAAVDAEKSLADEPLVLSEISRVIGTTYFRISEHDQARKHLEHALELLPAGRVRERMVVRELLADILSAVGDSVGALAAYEALYQERLAAFGPEDESVLTNRYLIAFELSSLGEFRRAADAAAALQPVAERVLGPEHPTTLSNLLTWTAARDESGLLEDGEKAYRELVARFAEVFGEMHSSTRFAQTSFIIHYLRQQRFADAERELRRLMPLAEAQFGKRSYITINFSALLGSALRYGGKLEESGPYYRLAMDEARALFGEHSTRTLNYTVNYANFEVASGRYADALQRLSSIEEPLTRQLGAIHPNIAELERARSRAHAGLGQRDAARRAMERALAIDRKVFGDDSHPQVAEDIEALATLQ